MGENLKNNTQINLPSAKEPLTSENRFLSDKIYAQTRHFLIEKKKKKKKKKGKGHKVSGSI